MEPIVIDELPAELANVFKGLVRDVTDPVFKAHLRDILQGEIQLLASQAAGGPPELIARGRQHTRAALTTLANVPGLVLAERRGEFEAIGSRVFDAIFAVGGLALEAYLTRFLGPGVMRSLAVVAATESLVLTPAGAEMLERLEGSDLPPGSIPADAITAAAVSAATDDAV